MSERLRDEIKRLQSSNRLLRKRGRALIAAANAKVNIYWTDSCDTSWDDIRIAVAHMQWALKGRAK